jgi:hypothetical protein
MACRTRCSSRCIRRRSVERRGFRRDEPTEPSPHQIPVSRIGPVLVRIVCGLLFATHDPDARVTVTKPRRAIPQRAIKQRERMSS